jgi:hypothetical protein
VCTRDGENITSPYLRVGLEMDCLSDGLCSLDVKFTGRSLKTAEGSRVVVCIKKRKGS